MSKKSNQITLEEAIQLKQNMQDLLINKRKIFERENCFPINSKRNYDLKKILTEKEELSENFINLKVEIQKANFTIPEEETFNISTLVYKLSEIKSDINIFEKSLESKSYTDGVKILNGEEITFKPQYDNEKIKDWLSALKKEYYYIESQLTKLNKLITINLLFDPTDLL